MPPGRVIKASDRSSISFLRSDIVSVNSISVQCSYSIPGSSKKRGATPMIPPPALKAPRATAPIRPLVPPPKTIECPLPASSAPRAKASST